MGKHKINTKFISRIFGIAIVIMLITSTNLWAKPKNSVEYTPFKSENPNASVYQCKYDKSETAPISLSFDRGVSFDFEEMFKSSSIAVYGWKKRKGGWEKLGQYQLYEITQRNSVSLYGDSNTYTHYAVEAEVPENSLTLSVLILGGVRLNLGISEEYKKLIGEKRAAEAAERQRLVAEEKAKKEAQRNAEIDAKAKEIAKGYVYHGTAEARRNQKLFSGGALEEGHAYYIPGFVVKHSGNMASIEQADGFLFSSQSSPVSVSYINQKVKGEVVESSSTIFLGKTIEISLSVVIVGGKAPLHTPVVIGLIE